MCYLQGNTWPSDSPPPRGKPPRLRSTRPLPPAADGDLMSLLRALHLDGFMFFRGGIRRSERGSPLKQAARMHSPIHNDISCSCPSPFPSLTGRYRLGTDSRCSGRARTICFFLCVCAKTVMSASPPSFQQLQPRQTRLGLMLRKHTQKKNPNPPDSTSVIIAAVCGAVQRGFVLPGFADCSDNTYCCAFHPRQ